MKYIDRDKIDTSWDFLSVLKFNLEDYRCDGWRPWASSRTYVAARSKSIDCNKSNIEEALRQTIFDLIHHYGLVADIEMKIKNMAEEGPEDAKKAMDENGIDLSCVAIMMAKEWCIPRIYRDRDEHVFELRFDP